MFKKMFFILIASLLSITFFSSCADINSTNNISNTDKPITISMWAYDKGFEDNLNQEFNKQHPEIKVNVMLVPWSEYDNRFRLSLATGTDMPDIVKVESCWWGKWLKTDGILDNLDNYGINSNDISPAMSNVVKNSQQEFVVAPVSIGLACFWYNKNVAKEYLGTDDPDDITNMLKQWNDLLVIGKTIKIKSNGKAFLFPDTMAIEELIIASNQKYIDNNVTKLKENLLPTFKIIETMLHNGYIAKYTGTNLNNSYSNNSVLFYPYADWNGAIIKTADSNSKNRWGVIAPPNGVFYRGGNGYAIPKKSKQENKNAAAERIKFVFTPQGSKAVIDSNQFSMYKQAYTDDVLKEKDKFFNVYLNKKFYDWSAITSQKIQYSKYDDIILKELRVQAFNMMVDNISASEAIDNALKEITTRLGIEGKTSGK